MNKKIILVLMLGMAFGFGFGSLLKNKRISELEYINNQLRLEYDELKIQNHELGWEVTSCNHVLIRTEEYCHSLND